jgi:hypothetical protein
MTNGDEIRRKTDAELAAYLWTLKECCADGWRCGECPLTDAGHECSKDEFAEYLRKEVKDEADR